MLLGTLTTLTQYYPTPLNHARCCLQPICTECFVQIQRVDPATHVPPISTPAACPFCVTPDFGVVYQASTQGAATDAQAAIEHAATAIGTGGAQAQGRASYAAEDPRVVLVGTCTAALTQTTSTRTGSASLTGRYRIWHARKTAASLCARMATRSFRSASPRLIPATHWLLLLNKTRILVTMGQEAALCSMAMFLSRKCSGNCSSKLRRCNVRGALWTGPGRCIWPRKIWTRLFCAKRCGAAG